ncbi:MAG: hypothetical protein HQK52_08075 [Oligoflexia bacterium]|nr:hypothetical protein [Oligoflexia bacterium]
MIIGIDIGLNGAIVGINKAGQAAEKHLMPTIGNTLNISELNKLLLRLRKNIDHVFIEKVSSMPKQGVASTFKFGKLAGIVEGLITSHGLKFTLVAPQTWQKEIFEGIDKKNLNPKQRALTAVHRLFPNIDLRASDRCKVQHDGLVDALLIAEYGRRKMLRD